MKDSFISNIQNKFVAQNDLLIISIFGRVHPFPSFLSFLHQKCSFQFRTVYFLFYLIEYKKDAHLVLLKYFPWSCSSVDMSACCKSYGVKWHASFSSSLLTQKYSHFLYLFLFISLYNIKFKIQNLVKLTKISRCDMIGKCQTAK